jgi:hypothetical protein
MGLRSALVWFERRVGIVGFASGTVIGIAGLYYALHAKRPIVAVRIVSQFDILDVRQPLADLSIFFQGNDIQRHNLNLRTLHVRFANEGEADLLQSQYDASDTWGLLLHGGRILKAQLLEASSSYITSHLSPQLQSDSVIQLGKVILEPGRHFTLDLLILHSKNVQPTLAVTGKIVGMDSIPVRFEPVAGAQASVWSRAFSGSPPVQGIRLFAYFVAAALAIAAVVASGVGISSTMSSRSQRRRAKEIRLVLDTSSAEEVVARDVLIHVYSVAGKAGLLATKSLIEDKKFLGPSDLEGAWTDFFFDLSQRHGVRSTPRGQPPYAVPYAIPPDPSDPKSPMFGADLAHRLREGRLIQTKDGVAQVHPAFHKLLTVAIERLVRDNV